jgi:hypothetical protein
VKQKPGREMPEFCRNREADGHRQETRPGALEVLEQFTLGHPWMPRPSRSHRRTKASRTTITTQLSR